MIKRMIISLCDNETEPAVTIDLKFPFEIERKLVERELAELCNRLHAIHEQNLVKH